MLIPTTSPSLDFLDGKRCDGLVGKPDSLDASVLGSDSRHYGERSWCDEREFDAFRRGSGVRKKDLKFFQSWHKQVC
jgi:hypothetical protein